MQTSALIQYKESINEIEALFPTLLTTNHLCMLFVCLYRIISVRYVVKSKYSSKKNRQPYSAKINVH